MRVRNAGSDHLVRGASTCGLVPGSVRRVMLRLSGRGRFRGWLASQVRRGLRPMRCVS